MKTYTDETLIDVLCIAGVMAFVARDVIPSELGLEIAHAIERKYGKDFHCTATAEEIVAAFLRHLVNTTNETETCNIPKSKRVPLCVLPNGREIYPGDKVYRTDLRQTVTAKYITIDYDGDEFLHFEEGGNAIVGKNSEFYMMHPEYMINLR